MHGYKTPRTPSVMVNKASWRAKWHLDRYQDNGTCYHVNEGFDIAHTLTMQNSLPVNGLEGVKQLYAIPTPNDEGAGFWVSYGEITDERTRFHPIVPVIAHGFHEKLDWIIAHLPHGSGINYDWSVDFGRTYIVCKNTYDTMHSSGMYGPSVDFTVRYKWDDDMQKPSVHDVVLNHRGGVWLCDDEGHLYNDRGGLTDYLEETLELF